jgi:pyruvate dehydrogenase E1 component
MPAGAEQGIVEGLYRFAAAPDGPSLRSTILFSGTSWLAAQEAQRLLAEHHDVAAELWSATSYKAMREEAMSAERWNRLHPSQPPRRPRVAELLAAAPGPYVAVSDFMKAVPDQIARWVPGRYEVLGTDGFGRSDTRERLRRHFEVDAAHVVLATLAALAADGSVEAEVVEKAIARYGVDTGALDPRTT